MKSEHDIIVDLLDVCQHLTEYMQHIEVTVPPHILEKLVAITKEYTKNVTEVEEIKDEQGIAEATNKG